MGRSDAPRIESDGSADAGRTTVVRRPRMGRRKTDFPYRAPRRFGWVTLYTFEGNLGRKRKLRMEVRVVPPGSLAKNRNNPHTNKTPEQRRQRMLTTLIDSLARIRAKETTETRTAKEVP